MFQKSPGGLLSSRQPPRSNDNFSITNAASSSSSSSSFPSSFSSLSSSSPPPQSLPPLSIMSFNPATVTSCAISPLSSGLPSPNFPSPIPRSAIINISTNSPRRTHPHLPHLPPIVSRHHQFNNPPPPSLPPSQSFSTPPPSQHFTDSSNISSNVSFSPFNGSTPGTGHSSTNGMSTPSTPLTPNSPTHNHSSSTASSFHEDILARGDLVGEGLCLQGERIRVVPMSLLTTCEIEQQERFVSQLAPEFEVVRKLGTGSYAVVYLVREVLERREWSDDGCVVVVGGGQMMEDDEMEMEDERELKRYGKEYAIKCLSKANLDQEALDAQMSEANIHQSLPTHSNIVTLHRTFETPSYLLLLLEFVPGEDLFYFLEQAKDHYEPDLSTVHHHSHHHHHDSSSSSMESPPDSPVIESPTSTVAVVGTDPALLKAKKNKNKVNGKMDEDSFFSSTSSLSHTPPSPSLLATLNPNQLLSRTRLRLIASMFAQMCEAVATCHDHDVFHRDIKPENFIVTDGWVDVLPTEDDDYDDVATKKRGSRERKVIVKLTDFGLSTTEKESADMDCGSAPYMSYECRNNCSPTYSPRSADVWSLGIVLINMLYHINPWTDTTDGVCPSFSLYRSDPYSFFMNRFTGMTPSVAQFLAERVFCILDQDDQMDLKGKRVSAREFGCWVRELLPRLLGKESGAAAAAAIDGVGEEEDALVVAPEMIGPAVEKQVPVHHHHHRQILQQSQQQQQQQHTIPTPPISAVNSPKPGFITLNTAVTPSTITGQQQHTHTHSRRPSNATSPVGYSLSSIPQSRRPSSRQASYTDSPIPTLSGLHSGQVTPALRGRSLSSSIGPVGVLGHGHPSHGHSHPHGHHGHGHGHSHSSSVDESVVSGSRAPSISRLERLNERLLGELHSSGVSTGGAKQGLATVVDIDADVEEEVETGQAEYEVVADNENENENENEVGDDGAGSRSQSITRRRKRGARKGKGQQQAQQQQQQVPLSPPPPSLAPTPQMTPHVHAMGLSASFNGSQSSSSSSSSSNTHTHTHGHNLSLSLSHHSHVPFPGLPFSHTHPHPHGPHGHGHGHGQYPSSVDETLETLASASQSLAREISRASRPSSQSQKVPVPMNAISASRDASTTPVPPLPLSVHAPPSYPIVPVPTSIKPSSSNTVSAPSQPQSPLPVTTTATSPTAPTTPAAPRAVAKKPSKWRLGFGKSSSASTTANAHTNPTNDHALPIPPVPAIPQSVDRNGPMHLDEKSLHQLHQYLQVSVGPAPVNGVGLHMPTSGAHVGNGSVVGGGSGGDGDSRSIAVSNSGSASSTGPTAKASNVTSVIMGLSASAATVHQQQQRDRTPSKGSKSGRQSSSSKSQGGYSATNARSETSLVFDGSSNDLLDPATAEYSDQPIPPVPPLPPVDARELWTRGRRTKISPNLTIGTASPAPSGHGTIERWAYNVENADVVGHPAPPVRRSHLHDRNPSPTSTRTSASRHVASSGSSIAPSSASSNWRSSSSGMTSTSAFTRYSNSSLRSVNTVTDATSMYSWRNSNNPSQVSVASGPNAQKTPKSPPHLNSPTSPRYPHGESRQPPLAPPNVKIMDGVPYGLLELPRQLHPNPVGATFGAPLPVRPSKRQLKPKEPLPLDTINEGLGGQGPRSPPSARFDSSPSYGDLRGASRMNQGSDTSTAGDFDTYDNGEAGESRAPKKVNKQQLIGLQKMLAAFKR